jgi:hypothetical protein
MAVVKRFFVTFEGQIIGSTNLAVIDAGMGVAHGHFHPEPGYAAIRPAVVRAAEGRASKRAVAPQPHFDLAMGTGEIVMTSAVVIDDFDTVAVDPEITAYLDDREQFLRLLGS